MEKTWPTFLVQWIQMSAWFSFERLDGRPGVVGVFGD